MLAGERLSRQGEHAGSGLGGVKQRNLFCPSDPGGQSVGQDQGSARARLGFVLHSAGHWRSWGPPVKQSDPSSGAPLLGWNWTHRAEPLPTAPCMGQTGQAALGFVEEQLWFLQPRDTLCVGVCP